MHLKRLKNAMPVRGLAIVVHGASIHDIVYVVYLLHLNASNCKETGWKEEGWSSRRDLAGILETASREQLGSFSIQWKFSMIR